MSVQSEERFNYQWKIDERILEAFVDLGLSDQKARDEFERIRALNENEIEEELANLEGPDEGPDDEGFEPLQYIATHEDLIEAFGADEAAGELCVLSG